MKKIIIFIMSAILVLSLTACSSSKKPIVIGEGDWDSNAFHDQVVKIIIEEGYGVETEIVTADTAIMVTGLKTQDIDVAMELWSDNLPTYDADLASGDYTELTVNFDDNIQGLYVPTYLIEGDDALAPDLKTVKDLKKYADLFPDPENSDKGIIYGGPEGWAATAMLHDKMEKYGLDEYYTFKTIDSSATLSAVLSGAYKKGEAWVGYSWEPTWIMGMYDMTLLEDSEYSPEDFEIGIGSFPSVDVTVVVTKGFEEEYPEIAEFLSNYTTSSQLTSAALGYMQENEAATVDAAKWFLNEKKELWKNMVTEDAAKKIEAAIQ